MQINKLGYISLCDYSCIFVDKSIEQKRTLYSLGHFYATHKLTKGNVTADQLAEYMGTSVGMIQQHYGHLDLLKLAHKFAGGGSITEALRKPKAEAVGKSNVT